MKFHSCHQNNTQLSIHFLDLLGQNVHDHDIIITPENPLIKCQKWRQDMEYLFEQLHSSKHSPHLITSSRDNIFFRPGKIKAKTSRVLINLDLWVLCYLYLQTMPTWMQGPQSWVVKVGTCFFSYPILKKDICPPIIYYW